MPNARDDDFLQQAMAHARAGVKIPKLEQWQEMAGANVGGSGVHYAPAVAGSQTYSANTLVTR